MPKTSSQIARMVDHTLLKPDAVIDEILQLCDEAKEYGFKAVCVQPCHVELCAEALRDTDISIAAVVGFPLGANCTEVKAFEAKVALSQGADEIDMVINIGALKSGQMDRVIGDIKAVVDESLKVPGTLVKVIIETALLNRDEKLLACRLAVEAGAQYVKTSTGFTGQGATIEDVLLMHEAVGDKAKVKASGGIRTREQALDLIEAGASRLGTSSGIAIIKE